MNTLKLLLVSLIAGVVVLPAANVYAFDPFGESCQEAEGSTVCADRNNSKAKDPIVGTIKRAANIIATVTGVLAVVMIIIGGLNLVVSSGNAEEVAKGRRRILYSLIGLVVVALAWTITRFITDRVL